MNAVLSVFFYVHQKLFKIANMSQYFLDNVLNVRKREIMLCNTNYKLVSESVKNV